MQEVDYYEVTEPNGSGEYNMHVVNFSKATDANAYAQKHGKSWPKYVTKKSIKIFDSIEDFEATKSKEVRDGALAKLTAVERAALGL